MHIKRKLYGFLVFIIIICILGGGIFLYGNVNGLWNYSKGIILIDNAGTENTIVSRFPIEYGVYNNLTAYNGLIVQINCNGLDWLDTSGNCTDKVSVNMTDPVFKTNGKYLVVGDSRGRRVSLYSGKKECWSKEFNDDIYSVDINDSGKVIVISSYIGYNSAVQVFDIKGNLLFVHASPSGRIVGAYMAEASDLLVLNVADISVCETAAKVVYIDIKTKERKEKRIKGKLAYRGYMMSGNNTVFSGSDKVSVFSAGGESVKTLNYKSIIGMERLNDNFVAVAAIPDRKDIENTGMIIELIDKNGNVRAQFDIVDGIKKIVAGYSTISVVNGKKLTVLNSSGDVVGGCELSREIKTLRYLDSKHLLVLTGNEAVICNLTT